MARGLSRRAMGCGWRCRRGGRRASGEPDVAAGRLGSVAVAPVLFGEDSSPKQLLGLARHLYHDETLPTELADASGEG